MHLLFRRRARERGVPTPKAAALALPQRLCRSLEVARLRHGPRSRRGRPQARRDPAPDVERSNRASVRQGTRPPFCRSLTQEERSTHALPDRVPQSRLAPVCAGVSCFAQTQHGHRRQSHESERSQNVRPSKKSAGPGQRRSARVPRSETCSGKEIPCKSLQFCKASRSSVYCRG